VPSREFINSPSFTLLHCKMEIIKPTWVEVRAIKRPARTWNRSKYGQNRSYCS
jgi:hypothetical protein